MPQHVRHVQHLVRMQPLRQTKQQRPPRFAPREFLAGHEDAGREDRDLLQVGGKDLARIVREFPGKTMLAEKVETEEDFNRCLDAGFRPGMGHVLPDRLFWAQPEESRLRKLNSEIRLKTERFTAASGKAGLYYWAGWEELRFVSGYPEGRAF